MAGGIGLTPIFPYGVLYKIMNIYPWYPENCCWGKCLKILCLNLNALKLQNDAILSFIEHR